MKQVVELEKSMVRYVQRLKLRIKAYEETV